MHNGWILYRQSYETEYIYSKNYTRYLLNTNRVGCRHKVFLIAMSRTTALPLIWYNWITKSIPSCHTIVKWLETYHNCNSSYYTPYNTLQCLNVHLLRVQLSTNWLKMQPDNIQLLRVHQLQHLVPPGCGMWGFASETCLDHLVPMINLYVALKLTTSKLLTLFLSLAFLFDQPVDDVLTIIICHEAGLKDVSVCVGILVIVEIVDGLANVLALCS